MTKLNGIIETEKGEKVAEITCTFSEQVSKSKGTATYQGRVGRGSTGKKSIPDVEFQVKEGSITTDEDSLILSLENGPQLKFPVTSIMKEFNGHYKALEFIILTP